MRSSLIIFIISLISLPLSAQEFPKIMDVVNRRVPWLTSSLVFKKEKTNTSEEYFSIEQISDKIQITATSSNAAAKGVGWYLKYYCHRSMSHLGDNLSPLQYLPKVEKKTTVSSPYQCRYALNYCTMSYSMAHYTWEDWERELDWMALNGVNLLLAPVGMEAVWQNTLLALGYTEKETLDFIAHPTFTAWWLMGNLEGWGGPVSKEVIEQQTRLQKKILRRMEELGIEPVMQGFYGVIPTSLKNKREIGVIPQGRWAGGFQRSDFLNPTDSAFSEIAAIYYDEVRRLYGSDIKFFGGDPFHEGGESGDLNISLASSLIQKAMRKAYPNSTWVLQGWHANPSTAMLNGLDRKHTLVIELFGENTDNWKRREGYEGTPFIWCNVSNFGEKTGLYGKLQRFADEVYKAKQSRYRHLLKGIGIIPEGINNNPVVYDWMLELGWQKNHAEVTDWIADYQFYRYGKENPVMEKAWEIFLKTIYSSPDVRQEGPPESLFCARPQVDISSVSSWGTHARHYDMKLFEEGVRLFISLEDEYKDSETYQIDKIDLLRQVLSNRGKVIYEEMNTAIKERDINRFTILGNQFLEMIQKQDKLLSRNRYFRLDYWLAQFKQFGTSKSDQLQAIRNAKMQYTIWGLDTNPNTNLHEYAHKEWSGLLGSLYYKRWKLFIDYQIKKLRGKEVVPPDFFEIEKQWINDDDIPFTPAISDAEYKTLIEELFDE